MEESLKSKKHKITTPNTKHTPKKSPLTSSHLLCRLAFAAVMLGILLWESGNIEHVDLLEAKECIRDYTFVWTEQINIYLRNADTVRNTYLVYC